MPAFSITDSVSNPADTPTVDFTSASSLANYVKSKLLHLAVVPEYAARKDQLLTVAASKPIKFDASVNPGFTLGSTAPEVTVTPGAKAELCADALAGSDLFDDDDFQVPATVGPKTAYVGLTLRGTVSASTSVPAADLTFGINENSGIEFEYLKAFSTAENQPTLAIAAKGTLAGFVIPAAIEDFARLAPGDICSVSGDGQLQLCLSASVSLPVNPLASVNLPLETGTFSIQSGLAAGLETKLTLKGSYSVRVEKIDAGAVRLSYIRKRETSLEVDATASAGVSVDLGSTDLLAKMLGTLEKGGVDPNVLGGLSKDEIQDFNSAVKSGLDHSLAASLSLAIEEDKDQSIAFQYELAPDRFSGDSREAVTRALRGDLTLLSAAENHVDPGGAIMPGVTLLNSVTSNAQKRGATLKINLLGIVNLISISQLLRKCEFLYEPASGDLTIKETAQSEKISVITDPVRKRGALQKALFDSVLATTTYVTGRAISMPALACEAVHFTETRNTGANRVSDYTKWFAILHLMTPEERTAALAQFRAGGESHCTIRVQLNAPQCEALFLDASGNLRPEADYAEIGRQALKDLVDPESNAANRIRYGLLNNPTGWSKAMANGPNPQLASLIPLPSTDPDFQLALAAVTGDVYDVAWWSDGMRRAGAALKAVRAWLAGSHPGPVTDDPAFKKLRDALQHAMLQMAKDSRLRFDQPWGLVCLFEAAGATGASGQITAQGITIEKSAAPVRGAAGAPAS